jgi:hypothetical protein
MDALVLGQVSLQARPANTTNDRFQATSIGQNGYATADIQSFN